MKRIFFLLFLLFSASLLWACSAFFLNVNGRLLFGRNYDWVSGNGMLVTNARGLAKTSMVADGETPVAWVSKYGSITFNQFGKEFPHGGMNEHGLVVELMWLDGTAYPAADGRGAVSELQWIQYQLDNSRTVAEVLATDATIRISNRNSVPLHFLVADAAGNAATVEFINGRLVAHHGKNLPQTVLTNTPYAEALQKTAGQKAAASFDDNSLDRFATACRMVQQAQTAGKKETAVDDAFAILNKVAQGDFTKWKVVYDVSAREIYFSAGTERKKLSLKAFDFACATPPRYLAINGKQGGDVTTAFALLSAEENKRMLQQSAAESKSHVTVSEESIEQGAAYFSTVHCKQ